MLPALRFAAGSGHLPVELLHGTERIVARLPALCGPEPVPSLLHGDAQQNNFLGTAGGAPVIAAAPYYGHPEADLALAVITADGARPFGRSFLSRLAAAVRQYR